MRDSSEYLGMTINPFDGSDARDVILDGVLRDSLRYLEILEILGNAGVREFRRG